MQRRRARLRQQARPACRTSSAGASCSRSSTPRATRWPSAGACCPATTARSTATRPRRSSTPRARSSTASTGPRKTVVHAGEVIVCEGYTDVIGFAQAGMPRAVATCGTALTEEHVRLLKRFAQRVVLAFDPDAAGQAAADRFYEWEHKSRHRRGGGRPARRHGSRPSSPDRSRATASGDRTTPPRSSGSASSGSSSARSCPRPRAGRGPPKRRSARSPSTRASSSATST